MSDGESTSAAECGVCINLRSRAAKAVEEHDRSAEADVRVLLRRHARTAHGVELPLPGGAS